ncbi:hypothetical protein AB4Y45_30785 [Paraburkholderia sp. EG287A]|uniref:hypothetical protein n=1 Tax=Paraburkholderia sp. EG287A TaxID=3237012 RepID=UPI0034D1CF3C
MRLPAAGTVNNQNFARHFDSAMGQKAADDEPARRNLNLGLIDVSKPLAKNLRMASFAYLRERTS